MATIFAYNCPKIARNAPEILSHASWMISQTFPDLAHLRTTNLLDTQTWVFDTIGTKWKEGISVTGVSDTSKREFLYFIWYKICKNLGVFQLIIHSLGTHFKFHKCRWCHNKYSSDGLALFPTVDLWHIYLKFQMQFLPGNSVQLYKFRIEV